MIIAQLERCLVPLERINALLGNAGAWLAAILIAVMATLVVVQVFFRYVLNSSLSWAEDLSLMLMIWMAFLIAPYAYRHSQHVVLDLIERIAAERITHIVHLFGCILTFCFLIYLVDVSIDYVASSTIRANAVPIQMRYVYVIMPIAFTMLAAATLEYALRSIIGVFDTANPTSRMPVVRQQEHQNGER